MRIVLILALAATVVGCATVAQQEAESINDRLTKLNAEVDACYTEVRSDQDVAALYQGRPLGAPLTLADLSDPAYATDDEIAATLRYHELVQPCRIMWMKGHQAILPTAVPVLARWFAQVDNEYVKFIKRESNWGESHSTLKAIEIEAESEMQEAYAQLDRDLNRSHESEMASRRAAAAALNAYRPITCRTVGSLTTCY